jgi:ParB-like nuclease domain
MRATFQKDAIPSAFVLENGKIEHLPVSELKVRHNNPRTHSPRQIRQIAHSIERFGFVNPIVVDRRKQVVCGHGRLAAARLIGLETLPTIALNHLSPDELRAYVIADNRLAERAGWDNDILAIELQGLSDLSFDLEATGFEIPEIELILDAKDPPTESSDDNTIPDLTPHRSITRSGDLWSLGEHRLLCGDARDQRSFATLLAGDRARLVFIDPPFNVKIRGHVSGKGRVKHREFAQASGEKTSPQFTKFLEEALSLLAEHSVDGAIHFVCSRLAAFGRDARRGTSYLPRAEEPRGLEQDQCWHGLLLSEPA